MKKRILYIITKTHYGGAQKYVQDLALSLHVDLDFEVHVAIGEGEVFPWITNLRNVQIPVPRLTHFKRNLSLFHDVASGFELYSLYKKVKPDIVHLNSSKIGATGSTIGWLYNKLQKQTMKIIYTVHGLVLKEPLPAWRKAYYWLAEWLGAKFKDLLICVSENDRNELLKYEIAPPQKIRVIHIGVDINALSFLDREHAREKLSDFSNCDLSTSIIVGTIGGYFKTKGHTYLIESVDAILKALPEKYDKASIKFCIIGSGPERAHLESLIETYNLKSNVFLLSIEEHAAKYLKAFDIFILPSVKEGLPYTLIEARAAGLPIIASNVGGVSEVIEDKKTGLLIPPADVTSIVQSTLLLIEDTQTRDAYARHSAGENLKIFSQQTMVDKTKRLYASYFSVK